MKLKLSQRDLVWSLAVILAFGAGSRLFPRPADFGQTASGGIRVAAGPAPQAAGAGDAANTAHQTKGQAEPVRWTTGYDRFVSSQDPLERQRLMQAALAGITRENWKEAWHPMWDSRREGRISDLEWRTFLLQFGAVGGEEVAAFGKPDDVVNEWESWNVRLAVEGWAAKDIEGSWAWISRQPEGNYRLGLLTGWMEGAAAVNPERAMEALRSLDPDKAGPLWSSAARKMAAHDPEKMKSWLAEISGNPGREGTGWVDGQLDPGKTGQETAARFFTTMLDSKLEVNPHDPAYVTSLKTWFDGYYGSAGVPSASMSRLASALQRSAPPADVLNWIGTHADDSGTFHAAATAMSRWANNEQAADDITAWLQANRENPAYDGAAAGFAVRAFQYDPDGARAWAATIRDPQQRDQLVQHLETMKKE